MLRSRLHVVVKGVAVLAAGAFVGWGTPAIANNPDYCGWSVAAQSQCSQQMLHNVVHNEAYGSYSVCERVEVVSTGELKSRVCNSGWAQSGNMGNVYRRNIVGNNHTSSQQVIGTVYH